MDLTNKIDVKEIAHKFSQERNGNYFSYEDAIRDTLKEITPKVAIDFAMWVVDNRWYSIKDNIFYQTLEFATSMNDKTYRLHHTKTPEQLFEEFLKDYKYEN